MFPVEELVAGLEEADEAFLGALGIAGHVDADFELVDAVPGLEHLDEGVGIGEGGGFGVDI